MIRRSLAIATILAAGAAQAAPVTFFGENLTPGGVASGDPVTARNDFLANLATGVSTEDFETATLPNINFAGSTGNITATLAGGGASIETGANGAGRFPTSGSRFVEGDSDGTFVVTFSSAVAAFGFFGTDIGDFNNALQLTLTAEDNSTTVLNVGNSTTAPNASLLFFGFIDTDTSYVSVEFGNVGGGGDVFGFDDLTIGDIGQVVTPPPSVIPLPATAALMLLGLGGLGLAARRRG